ncbi:unnamed protein product [Adineta steineri]|uniref:SOCS box domain-containing protein n=1 Tax=Adineta steineri TaxID=433720 RepID=A0A813R3R6_9BILA|nr:unnamed protein product [Adineta steineri]CAF0906629.1 unnamed protein product [Adineta steineri]
MTNQSLATSNVLPLNDSLQNYLTSSTFLPNNVWKTSFSPCSHYLAIPKQDIYGIDCIIVIYCPNWHATSKTDELYVHEKFVCSSSVWSLAFGQRIIKTDSFDQNISLPLTRRQLLGRHRSTLSVNNRFDFTKNLFLAAGLADGKINIWNVDNAELILVLTDHKSAVCGLAFTPCTMQLASCSHDTKIKLWDLLDDGNMYKTLDEWTHVINTVKWSPDETLLCAVGPYELVVLYDTATWEEIWKFEGHLHSVADCDFSSDSALLATASFDTRILLWSTITGELLKEFIHKIPIPLQIYAGGDNGAFVRSVVFTKYNQIIISTCDDNHVRLFPIESARLTEPSFKQSQNNVLCVTSAPDGKTMGIGTRNGEVHLWSILSTYKLPSLKSFCRITINSHAGIKRKEIVNLSISQCLINYLLYKDIKSKQMYIV